jgi:hypothetical protein
MATINMHLDLRCKHASETLGPLGYDPTIHHIQHLNPYNTSSCRFIKKNPNKPRVYLQLDHNLTDQEAHLHACT